MRTKLLPLVVAVLLFPLERANAFRGGLPGPGDLGFSPGGHRVTGCTNFAGVDACALFGLHVDFFSAQDQCMLSGSFWVAQNGWWTNVQGGTSDLPLVYPPGYVPAFPDNPYMDFLSKFASVRVVVDGGTRQEKTYVYSPADIAYPFILGRWFNLDPKDPYYPLPGQYLLPLMHPLSVGAHDYQVYWTFSAPACDGLTASFELSCAPAGESLLGGVAFTVAPVCNP